MTINSQVYSPQLSLSMTSIRILVVEDESILALDIEDILNHLGYEVIGLAIDAEEAIAAIAQSPPDLVLMDVRLQGAMDGIEATRQIWTRFRLPVVFLTASTDEATLQRIKTVHAFGYIVKPFAIRKLETMIQSALESYRTDLTP